MRKYGDVRDRASVWRPGAARRAAHDASASAAKRRRRAAADSGLTLDIRMLIAG